MLISRKVGLVALLVVVAIAGLIACSPVGTAPPTITDVPTNVPPALATDTPVPTAVTTRAPTSPIEALADVRQRLAGTDEVARLTAIAQLEANSSPEAVNLLGTFFMDSNVRGRLEAARALLRINTALSLNYIRTAMSDKQLTGRRQVAMQALEADPEASYPILRTLIADPDETVRINTVKVAQFLGTAQARVLIQQAVRDSAPAVQQAAKDALAAMGFVPTPAP